MCITVNRIRIHCLIAVIGIVVVSYTIIHYKLNRGSTVQPCNTLTVYALNDTDDKEYQSKNTYAKEQRLSRIDR